MTNLSDIGQTILLMEDKATTQFVRGLVKIYSMVIKGAITLWVSMAMT